MAIGPMPPTLGFVEVPAGNFRMGSDADEDSWVDNARPPHELTLPDYYIARWPVTVGMFPVTGSMPGRTTSIFR